jgi:hypothetical protein
VVLVAVVLVGTFAVAHNGDERVRTGLPPTTARAIDADSINDIRPAISAARLTERVLIDHGALVLAPARTLPKVSEATAVARFRAGTPPSTRVGDDVVVFAARVTVVPSATTEAGRPQVQTPTFRERVAWVTLWGLSGAVTHCPALTGPPPSGPAAFSALLLSSDGHEALEYTTAGVKPCHEYANHPAVTVGSVTVSLRWERVERAGTWVARYQVPPCGHLSISETSKTGAAGDLELTIYAEAPLVRGSCPPPPVGYEPISGPPVRVLHGPTGQLPGRSNTAGSSLRYFDGKVRTAD